MVNKNHVDVLNKPPQATPQASPCSRDYFPKWTCGLAKYDRFRGKWWEKICQKFASNSTR